MTGNPNIEAMEDRIERLGFALIQHGPLSDRVYLMKLEDADKGAEAAEHVLALARARDYGKVFVKAPAAASAAFLELGFEEEARVPGMLCGKRDVCFLARFRKPSRAKSRDAEAVRRVLDIALARTKRRSPPRVPSGYTFQVLGQEHCQEMAVLYGRVFASYPFPIHDPRYLCETMRSHVRYMGAFKDGGLAAVASAELDRKGRNAEMTDFATLPEHRGQGLASILLARLEEEAARLGVLTAYTIARAVSPGMNITFARAGYAFAGTLTRNTNIAGALECMNVWHKPLRQSETRTEGRDAAA
ncbi:beta-lysine acetyltransferase [Desulfocurvibacter africanus PCS]|uniref:Beta-lysine acetyltransferase n=1 Tax=Desulfocurvibacter africanus PCS TaxID=1262666 RepID=M5PYM2_DESAF|nr:putative beta-lysine N-acetyltransferase [Desulfocurvibacter africanus]EMG39125.1 beta-lysine acetyltransferase [Desulfocurvibacter africanus PCS]